MSLPVAFGWPAPPLFAVAGFLVAVFPLVATPGASFTLLAQRVGAGGRGESLPVTLGTITGLYVHAAMAGAGLSAVVMGSSQLFAVVKLAGAVYLVLLGVWTWRSATANAPAAGVGGVACPWSGRSTYVQALLGNVLNPKAASIYLTLLPQFLVQDQPVFGQVIVLATAHAVLIVAWLLGWTIVISKATDTVRSAAFTRTINRGAGALLVALGLKSTLAA